jgi:hypothetical protein
MPGARIYTLFQMSKADVMLVAVQCNAARTHARHVHAHSHAMPLHRNRIGSN